MCTLHHGYIRPEITFDEEGVCNHCKAYDIRAATSYTIQRPLG